MPLLPFSLFARCAVMLLAAGLLVACAGVPLSTMGYLATRGGQALEGDPAGFAVAIQHDARMPLAAEAAPELQIRIAPKEAGAFPVIDERMRMRQVALEPVALGLPAADSGMRWRVYVLKPEQVERMRAVQLEFRTRREAPGGKAGGSLSIGVGIESLASGANPPDGLRLESWLRLLREDGFRKLWSGSVGDLHAAARARQP